MSIFYYKSWIELKGYCCWVLLIMFFERYCDNKVGLEDEVSNWCVIDYIIVIRWFCVRKLFYLILFCVKKNW